MNSGQQKTDPWEEHTKIGPRGTNPPSREPTKYPKARKKSKAKLSKQSDQTRINPGYDKNKANILNFTCPRFEMRLGFERENIGRNSNWSRKETAPCKIYLRSSFKKLS